MIRAKNIALLTKIAKRYLNNYYIGDEIGGSIGDDNYDYIIDDLIDHFGDDVQWDNDNYWFWLKPYNLHFWVVTGVSKMVIVFEDLNAVIKIPFNGAWDYPNEFDDDDDDKIDYDEVEQQFFTFTRGGLTEDSTPWDYIAREIALREKIEEIDPDFAEYYLPNYLIYTTAGGYPIYAQEKAISLWHDENINRTTIDSEKRARVMYFSGIIRCDEWAAVAIDKYGEENFKKFDDFIRLTDNRKLYANDLHQNNIGYTVKDGRPVIIDYAGWYDSY